MALAAALAAPAVVRAQEVPAPEPADEAAPEPVDEAAPPAEPSPGPLGEAGWGWKPVGPLAVLQIADIAVHPTDPALIAVVSMRGTVYLSPDEGERWFAVLEAAGTRLGETSADERVRQEFEVQLDEVLGATEEADVEQMLEDGDALDESDALDAVADTLQDAVDEVSDQVQSELQANPEFFRNAIGAADQQLSVEGRPQVERPRVWITRDDRLFVARSDGLWLTEDLGTSWAAVIDEPVMTVAFGASGWWAGTRAGVWASDDGAKWRDTGWLDPYFVYDLMVVEGTVFAATSGGLFRLERDGRWLGTNAIDSAVVAVAADPEASERLWFATVATVYRSESGGADPEPNAERLPPIRDLTWVAPGSLGVATAAGLLVSTDGGASWGRLGDATAETPSHAVTLVADRLWVSSDQGLLEWVPPEELPRLERPPAVESWVALESLIGASLSREGLSVLAGGLGTRWGASLVPRLRAEFRWYPGTSLTFRDTSGTTRDPDGVWQAIAWLEWRPEGRRSGGSVDVIVSGGDVLVDDGRDQTVLAARVGRQGQQYRQSLVRAVSALYYRRAELVAERPTRQGSPLPIRIDHELRIAEVEAQLDVLTDGAVSSWQAARALSQEVP